MLSPALALNTGKAGPVCGESAGRLLHDPLLSELRDPASSESDGKDLSLEVPAGNWADYMDYVELFAKFKPEPFESTSKPQDELAAHCDDDDMLEIGLNMPGLLVYEQVALSSGQYTVSVIYPSSHCTANLQVQNATEQTATEMC